MTGSLLLRGRYVAVSRDHGVEILIEQSAIAQAPSIGAIFGVYWGAWLNDRYGYRWSLIINYLITIPIVFLFFFATNREMLLMAGLLIGYLLLSCVVWSRLTLAYSM
jgi:predicted MFS family arabinose efflux permease